MGNHRNIQRICEEQPDMDYYQMQHFITESKWDARGVMDHVAVDVSSALPKRKLTGLILDESGIVKKGDKSVAVAHQYCGSVGKTANSQVAVVACLCNGDFASLVDARLYLPENWAKDSKRCDRAGIPSDFQKFKTKPEIALEIVKHQKALGVDFDYVGGDGLYGHDPALARGIDELGYVYMLDVHKDQHIFCQEPAVEIPLNLAGRGRKPSVPKPDKKSIE